MKTRHWLVIALLAGGLLLAVNAATDTPTPSKSAGTSGSSTPGVAAAQALSTVTGVAISPLLGVGAVGAWTYLQHQRTPVEQRGALPWFAQPWFWIPALLLVSIAFAKDVMGPVIPTVLKKPFDVAEVFENKVSALVAAGAFVPLIAAIFSAGGGPESHWNGLGLAMANPSALLNVLTVPLAVVVFLLVWMASHVVNVLILISPFAVVDAGLKSVRLFLLGTVTLTAWTDPYAGAAFSLILIILAYFLSGWSFRLTIFGTVFAWDLLTLRQTRCQPSPTTRAFTARRLEKVPVRTCGKLVRDDQGGLTLKFRPWLVLRERTLTLPSGQYTVGRGLVYPEMLLVEGASAKTMLTFPPRYRTHEEELARVYGLAGVQDVGFVKGLKAVWRWLTELFGFGTQPAPAG